MKKKAKTSKARDLIVSTEKVRELQPSDLNKVVGGAGTGGPCYAGTHSGG